MGVTKIRTIEPDDDKLVEICREEIKCGDCSKPTWQKHQDRDEICPPEGTVAIIVDIRDNKAAIRVFDKQTDDYVDGVGTEEAGKLVIVPWKSNWLYFCTGSPRVGHIAEK